MNAARLNRRRPSVPGWLSRSALLLFLLTVVSVTQGGWQVIPKQARVRALLVTGSGAAETVWAAVGSVLVELDVTTGETRRVHTVADGLLGESIDGLVEDRRGIVWVAYGLDLGWENHLSRLSSTGEWERVAIPRDSRAPYTSNRLFADASGGIHVVDSAGAAHRDADGAWEDNGRLFGGRVPDGAGGGWWIDSGRLVNGRAEGDERSWDLSFMEPSAPTYAELRGDPTGGVWVFRRGWIARVTEAGELSAIAVGDSPQPEARVTQLTPDGLGGAWVQTVTRSAGEPRHLLHYGAVEGWRGYPEADQRLPAEEAVPLVSGRAGRAWFAGVGELFRVAADAEVSRFTWGEEWLSDRIDHIADDGAGGLWLATASRLLHRPAGGGWEEAALPETVTGEISALVADGEGGTWLLVSGVPYHRDSSGEVTIHPEVFPDDGEALVDYGAMVGDGTGGVWLIPRYRWSWWHLALRLDRGGVVELLSPEDFGGHDLLAMTELRASVGGNLWVVFDGGFYHRAPGGGWREVSELRPQGERLPSMTLLPDGAEGGIWALVSAAVSGELQPSAFQGDPTQAIRVEGWPDVLSLAYGALVATGDAGLWVAKSNQLARMEPSGAWRIVSTGQAARFSTGAARAIHADGEGGVWLATDGGLLHYLPGEEEDAPNVFTEAEQSGEWLQPVSSGGVAGRSGETDELIGLRMRLEGASGCRLRYRVSGGWSGWSDWFETGETAEVDGFALDAVEMELMECPDWRLRYRADMRGIGWLSWKEEGGTAGFPGSGETIRALRVELLSHRAEYVPYQLDLPYVDAGASGGYAVRMAPLWIGDERGETLYFVASGVEAVVPSAVPEEQALYDPGDGRLTIHRIQVEGRWYRAELAREAPPRDRLFRVTDVQPLP